MLILYNANSIGNLIFILNKSAEKLQEQLDSLKSTDDSFVTMLKGNTSDSYKVRIDSINENLKESIQALESLSERVYKANEAMILLDTTIDMCAPLFYKLPIVRNAIMQSPIVRDPYVRNSIIQGVQDPIWRKFIVGNPVLKNPIFK